MYACLCGVTNNAHHLNGLWRKQGLHSPRGKPQATVPRPYFPLTGANLEKHTLFKTRREEFVRVCVCVCVCEREGERERQR
ncbi:hypothetical protein AALO_G00204440, partial [Alosa alosa]